MAYYYANYSRANVPVVKTCPVCEIEFTTTKKLAKCCSEACRQARLRVVRRAYRTTHGDEIRAKVRLYRQKNHDRVLAQGREWRAANPERVRELGRAWAAINREFKNDRAKRRNAKFRAALKALRALGFAEGAGWVPMKPAATKQEYYALNRAEILARRAEANKLAKAAADAVRALGIEI